MILVLYDDNSNVDLNVSNNQAMKSMQHSHNLERIHYKCFGLEAAVFLSPSAYL